MRTGDRRFSERVERMLDVMLCLPRRAWAVVLTDVEKRIGTAALHKIILRACSESGSYMFELNDSNAQSHCLTAKRTASTAAKSEKAASGCD